MTFDSLQQTLEGALTSQFDSLSLLQQQRVKSDFFNISWDKLSPDQRRSVAAQWDALHDQGSSDRNKGAADLFETMYDLDKKIEQWTQASANTVGELVEQERHLEKLHDMKRQLHLARGDVVSDGTGLENPANDFPHAETSAPTVVEQSEADLSAPGADPELGSPAWRRQNASKAALARHNQPNGSNERRARLREAWASGRYRSRDKCAQVLHESLGMAISTARKVLRGTPDPVIWVARNKNLACA